MTNPGPAPENPATQAIGTTLDTFDRELSRKEVRRVMAAVRNQIVPLGSHEKKIFVLGSYDEDAKWKLQLVQEAIQEIYRLGGVPDIYVYRMDDIGGGVEEWVNAEIKFRFLANIADEIVSVAEHDQGGAVFEQGILSDKFIRKTKLLKREYGSERVEHEKYSFMQSEGVFRKFDNMGRLYRWDDIFELLDCCYDICEQSL